MGEWDMDLHTTCGDTHTDTNTNTHTLTHTHTHTHTQARAHAHAHTQTQYYRAAGADWVYNSYRFGGVGGSQTETKAD